MPRYLVERSFPTGLHIPVNAEGARITENVINANDGLGVTWIASYVSDDKLKSFCIYDAPTPEAVRKAAERNRLPVDRITKVTVLDPYFYH